MTTERSRGSQPLLSPCCSPMGSSPRAASPTRFGLETYVQAGIVRDAAGLDGVPARPSSRAAPGPPTRSRWRAPRASPRAGDLEACLDLDAAARRHALGAGVPRGQPADGTADLAGRRSPLARRGLRSLAGTLAARAWPTGSRRRDTTPPSSGLCWAARASTRRSAAAAYLHYGGRAGRERGAAAPAARAGRGAARARRRPPAHRPARRRGRRGDVDDLWSFTPGTRDRGTSPRGPRGAVVPLVIPRPLKIGIGGPVGSGKTALAEGLCRRFRDHGRHGGGHQRHLHEGGRGVPHAPGRPARRGAWSAWRRAAARTRRFARTPR